MVASRNKLLSYRKIVNCCVEYEKIYDRSLYYANSELVGTVVSVNSRKLNWVRHRSE